MRLIDADKVPPLSDLSGCAYEGSEYQAYKSGAEYGRGLVDDTPTVDPESLRPTAHWIKEDCFYKDSTVWRCAACKGKFVLHGETPENVNYQYCPACSAIIIKDGQGR